MPLGSLRGASFTSFFIPNAADFRTAASIRIVCAALLYLVGYQEISTRSTGYSMAGGTFATVGDGESFCLKDVAVQCYGTYVPTYRNKKWSGGCKAPSGFQLMVLDETGHTEATYYWQFIKEGEELTPTVTEGWFKDDGAGGYVKLTQEELAEPFASGSGFYIYGRGNALRPAGQVPGDVEMKSLSTGYCVIANGTPCDMTLGDVSVTCYGTYVPTYRNKKWSGGCKAPSGFQLMVLDDTGHTEKTYYWQFIKEGEELTPTVTEGWFKDDGAGGYVKLTQEELDAVEVKAGAAYYIYGRGNQLNFPGPEL